jgi:hypothetical protein
MLITNLNLPYFLQSYSNRYFTNTKHPHTITSTMVLVVWLLLPLLSGGRSNYCQESQRQAVAGNESA